MGRMFPDFNPEFKDVITQMSAFTKSGKLDAKTINNITTDLYAYIMSGKRFLGGTNEEMRGKRDAFINKFIPEYNRIIANNSDIAKLDIIKALQVQKSTKDGSMDVLVSRSIGDLSQAKKEAITNSWTSLFYMSEEGQQLAMNLFQYAYYRNGFGFANNSFMHLAPTVIKEAAPEYLNTLRGLISQRISPENAKDYYQHFLLQYLRNHADNRRLVPNIDVHNTKVEFVDSQHEIKNEITITIDKNSTSEDRKFVSKINSQEIAWRPLISVNYKGGEELFVNDNYFDDSEAGRDTVTYTRVEPLGLKGNFLEYEFDTPHNEISSVIDRESLEIPKGRDTGKAILWEGGNNADYEEYIKNNPDLQAPSIGYEATERNDIAAKQAIEEQFGKHTLEDAPRDVSDAIKHAYMDEEIRKRMEEDNNC